LLGLDPAYIFENDRASAMGGGSAELRRRMVEANPQAHELEVVDFVEDEDVVVAPWGVAAPVVTGTGVEAVEPPVTAVASWARSA
jgi:hypothetical protein